VCVVAGWTPTGPASSLPELQHNLKLLVELTLNDQNKLEREVTYAEQHLQSLSAERDALEAAVQTYVSLMPSLCPLPSVGLTHFDVCVVTRRTSALWRM
jgi:hypothetical protein